ncbi:unnamed protein product, partial [Ixodes hexagonus]
QESTLSGGLICVLLLLQTALQQVSAASRSRYGRRGRIQQTADSSDEPYWSPPPPNSHHGPNRRYDQFEQHPDYYYDYSKHDYKTDYDIVFPLLLLIMAPLAVSAFLLPITASLMTNTFFLVNGATNAAIQGRRRRSASRETSPELLEFLKELEKAIDKYGSQDAQKPLKAVPI